MLQPLSCCFSLQEAVLCSSGGVYDTANVAENCFEDKRWREENNWDVQSPSQLAARRDRYQAYPTKFGVISRSFEPPPQVGVARLIESSTSPHIGGGQRSIMPVEVCHRGGELY